MLLFLQSWAGLDLVNACCTVFPSELRDEIVARYPREHFKEGFVEALFGGFAHKPGTAFVGVSERFIPAYKSPNVCDLIAASPFPDSELQS